MFTYYKGNANFPNRKAEFYGFLEKGFHETYTGKPEDKEEAFKDFMLHYLTEKVSDLWAFNIDTSVEVRNEKLRELLSSYLNPEADLGQWS